MRHIFLSFLLHAENLYFYFLCLCNTPSFPLLAQKKGVKKRAGEIDAEIELCCTLPLPISPIRRCPLLNTLC